MPKKSESNLDKQIEELDKIITYFNSDDFDLEEGMQQYEKAIELVENISGKLQGYEAQIEVHRGKLSQILDQ